MRYHFAKSLALIALVLGLPLATYAQDTVSAPVVQPAAGNQLIPERFLRRWDPVTVFFSEDTGPQAPGPEDAPERYLRITPAHPGAYTWINARTLMFQPADPWPALARFRFEHGGEATTLATLMHSPIASEPADGADDLDPVAQIHLRFADPLAAEALARMISIAVRPLPGVEDSPAQTRWLGAEDFAVKALDRHGLDDPADYLVSLHEPIAAGMRAELRLRLALDDAPDQAFQTIGFATAAPFRIESVGCGGQSYPITPQGVVYSRENALACDPEDRRVQLAFSAEMAPLSPIEVRNLLRITPAVDALEIQQDGRTLLVGGRFHADTVYELTLRPQPIRDRQERLLDLRAPSTLSVYFPPQAAFLDVPHSHGIVERYGPQMLPLSGRGDERVDVRIHAIDPLDRSFWPFPDEPIVIDEDQRPPGPGETPAPFAAGDRSIDANALALQIRALGSPAVSDIVDLPLDRKGPAARFGLDLRDYLASISGAQQPGTYLIGVRRLDGGSERTWVRVQATDLSLSAIEEEAAVTFAVTSLREATPVGGARILLEGFHNRQWTELATGVTDSGGLFRWQPPLRRWDNSALVRIRVDYRGDHLVMDANQALEHYQDNLWRSDGETWLQWTFSAPASRIPDPQYRCHLFTERPLYRPEENVHVRGYLRRHEHGRYQIVSPPADLIVSGPNGLNWRYPITWMPSGGFYHLFDEGELPTGTYDTRVELRLADKRVLPCGQVSFKKEAYRIPRFEVRLHGPDVVPLDRPFEVSLTAGYYAGGPVQARPLHWRVTQFPYTWTPKAREGFVYSSDGRFSGREAFEASPVQAVQGDTDDNGGARLTLDPTIETTAQPRSYVIEATVTGADDQTVTATKRVHALPPLALGLKTPRYVERPGTIAPELIVVGPEGELIAGQTVQLRLRKRLWHAHLQATDFTRGEPKYVTEVVDETVLEQTLTSTEAALTTTLPVPTSGVYILELETQDRLGRAQTVAVDFFVGGNEPVTWSKPPAKVFTVTTDKPDYAAGETARFILQSPFQQARALAIVETPQGFRYQWVNVEGGSAVFEWPIDASHLPKLPVHFLLMRGRIGDAQPAGTLDLGKPTTLAATAWVEVRPEANHIEVTLEHADKAQPGDTVPMTIRLADNRGQPLAGEVTLWLVDQAVLALAKEQRLEPLPDLIVHRDSLMRLRDTRNLSVGFLPFEEAPGGDGEAERGGDVLDNTTVRRNFQTVPYYNPAIVVDASGTATVNIALPDNLTVFKIRAKATSGTDRFGVARSQIAVRLPVIVQPALPRFVRPGDRFIASAIGRIVEGGDGPGRAQLRMDGLILEDDEIRDFTWQGSQPLRLDAQVSVPTPPYDADGRLTRTSVSVTVGVERLSDQARDAFAVSLPLLPDRSPVVRQRVDHLDGTTPVTLPALDEAVRPGTLRRMLWVSDQPALIEMAAGLNRLMALPYDCTEQRISRARALIATRRFQALTGDPGETVSGQPVEDTLAWIGEAVDGHGLVAYWPGGRGYVSLTAWTLRFLTEAERAGHRLDPALVAQLKQSLQQALRSDYTRFIDGEAYAERVMALAALAAAGSLDGGYAAELARRADTLDAEGIALVLEALYGNTPGQAGTVDALLDRLWQSLVFRLQDGQEMYAGLQRPQTLRNPLILPSESRTVAQALGTLSVVDRDAARTQVLADALVRLGRGDGWGNSNADAAALLALAGFLHTAEGGGPVRHAVTVASGEDTRVLTLGRDARIARWVGLGAEAVALSADSDDDAPLIVRSETRYLPAADGSRVRSASRGFVVNRHWQHRVNADAPWVRVHMEAPGQALQVPVGAVIEEHVQVITGEDRTHVAITVPLAAGLEPLNPNLATAPPDAAPSGQITLAPSYARYQDDQVAFFYDELPKGTYDFFFRTRATVAGEYIQPAAEAAQMYHLAVNGNSHGARVIVTPAAAP